jgi:hypothetical protein
MSTAATFARSLRVPAASRLANSFARRTMLAPMMGAPTPAVEEHGEIVIVGEIEVFWAPVLHAFRLP